MRPDVLGVAIGLAVFWWWWTHPPTGTVTTSEDFTLSPTAYPDALVRAAQAIARAEGFYVSGSVPARANNPGDLKNGDVGFGAINGITVYGSVDAGWQALYRQLWLIVTGQSAVYNLDMSVREMGARWTATEPDAWAANVAADLGVSASTPLYQVIV